VLVGSADGRAQSGRIAGTAEETDALRPTCVSRKPAARSFDRDAAPVSSLAHITSDHDHAVTVIREHALLASVPPAVPRNSRRVVVACCPLSQCAAASRVRECPGPATQCMDETAMMSTEAYSD